VGNRELGALLRILRANGVTRYKAGDVELELTGRPEPAPRKGSKSTARGITAEPEDARGPYEQLASEIWPNGIPRVREPGKPVDEAEVD
jgi:hypothetical protein